MNANLDVYLISLMFTLAISANVCLWLAMRKLTR